jgi:hypothetical protein
MEENKHKPTDEEIVAAATALIQEATAKDPEFWDKLRKQFIEGVVFEPVSFWDLPNQEHILMKPKKEANNE